MENSFIVQEGIPFEKMPLYFSISDIVCLPSLNETFGMALAEAQSMEKPVIGSNTGGTKEVIINKKTGFLIKPRSESELSKDIAKLLENKKLRIEMGTNGRINIKKKFDSEKIAKKVLKVYLEVLDKK